MWAECQNRPVYHEVYLGEHGHSGIRARWQHLVYHQKFVHPPRRDDSGQSEWETKALFLAFPHAIYGIGTLHFDYHLHECLNHEQVTKL